MMKKYIDNYIQINYWINIMGINMKMKKKNSRWLALSESMNNSRDASEISINESLLTQTIKVNQKKMNKKWMKELRRALELSLIEH